MVFNDLRPRGFRYGARVVGQTCGKRPYLDTWGSVRLRTASTHWNVPGKHSPHGELFFFLIRNEQVVASNEVLPNPCVSAEMLQACALIGLHLPATDCEVGSGGSQSLDLGDIWRYGCPKSPDWDSDGGSWSESEGFSSSDFREHNVESLAPNVVGQEQSGEKISLVLGSLGTFEGGLELPHRPGYVVPGNGRRSVGELLCGGKR